MNKIVFQTTYGSEEIGNIAEQIIQFFPQVSVVAFRGTIGAGKTTLIQALLRKLGVQEEITSPTFTYVNQYQNQQGQCFNHFDLYRISTMQEVYNKGFHELFETPGCWSFIEWPEVAQELLQHQVLYIDLELIESGAKRAITATLYV
jgi:tRNA threonylcarbamoyladenosine biosynthesis protein TsaE